MCVSDIPTWLLLKIIITDEKKYTLLIDYKSKLHPNGYYIRRTNASNYKSLINSSNFFVIKLKKLFESVSFGKLFCITVIQKMLQIAFPFHSSENLEISLKFNLTSVHENYYRIMCLINEKERILLKVCTANYAQNLIHLTVVPFCIRYFNFDKI